MRSTALPCRRPSRRCNAAIRCPAHRTATSTARNAARRCRPCTRLLYSRLRRMAHPSHSFSSPRSRRLMHRTAYIPQQASLPRIAMRRQFSKWRLPHLFASSQPSSRSEEHTSELQSPCNLVCRLLLEKKTKNILYICLREKVTQSHII